MRASSFRFTAEALFSLSRSPFGNLRLEDRENFRLFTSTLGELHSEFPVVVVTVVVVAAPCAVTVFDSIGGSFWWDDALALQ